jgi:hypothetical protein
VHSRSIFEHDQALSCRSDALSIGSSSSAYQVGDLEQARYETYGASKSTVSLLLHLPVTIVQVGPSDHISEGQKPAVAQAQFSTCASRRGWAALACRRDDRSLNWICLQSDLYASECWGCHRIAAAERACGELMDPVLAHDDGACRYRPTRDPPTNNRPNRGGGGPPTAHGVAFNRPLHEIFLVEL